MGTGACALLRAARARRCAALIDQPAHGRGRAERRWPGPGDAAFRRPAETSITSAVSYGEDRLNLRPLLMTPAEEISAEATAQSDTGPIWKSRFRS